MSDPTCYIPGGKGLPLFEPGRDTTALLIIDVQYACAHPDFGVGRRTAGEQRAAAKPFFERVRSLVLPNLGQLQSLFRREGMPIVHTRVGGLTEDGRDVGWRLRSLGFGIPATGIEAQFLPEVAPKDGEIVLTKTTSDVFLSTQLDALLRNLGVTSLVAAGVVTNGCVESTVRTAGDLGYRTWLIEDACAAHDASLHEAALRNLRDNWALVRKTGDVLDVFARARAPLAAGTGSD